MLIHATQYESIRRARKKDVQAIQLLRRKAVESAVLMMPGSRARD
jgi:hypothetical protein